MEYKKLSNQLLVVATVMVIGFTICISAVFGYRPGKGWDNSTTEMLEQHLQDLKAQNALIRQVVTEQAQMVEDDRRRDSLQQLQYERLVSRNREILNQLTQLRNERIDRINDPRFGADSIRRAFAE